MLQTRGRFGSCTGYRAGAGQMGLGQRIRSSDVAGQAFSVLPWDQCAAIRSLTIGSEEASRLFHHRDPSSDKSSSNCVIKKCTSGMPASAVATIIIIITI